MGLILDTWISRVLLWLCPAGVRISEQGPRHACFDQTVRRHNDTHHEHRRGIRRHGQDQDRCRASDRACRAGSGHSKPPGHALVSVGHCGRGGTTWDKSGGHVRGSVLQVQRRPASGVSGNSDLSALSLESGPLSDGGLLLPAAALRGHQSRSLQQAQFHVGPRSGTATAMGVRLQSLRGAALSIAAGKARLSVGGTG